METFGATLSVLSARRRSRAAFAEGGSDSGAGGSLSSCRVESLSLQQWGSFHDGSND